MCQRIRFSGNLTIITIVPTDIFAYVYVSVLSEHTLRVYNYNNQDSGIKGFA